MRNVIALDVGGTGMKAALVGADGTLLHEARRPTGRERGPEAVIETVLGFAAELHALGRERFGAPADAAGVAVPGIVDEASGTAVYAANLGWRDVPMRALLSERLGGVPVALGHDVRAVWQTAVDALADGLVTGLTLLDPETLIIGGGLAEAGDTLFVPLREAVRRRVTFQPLPSIVPAALGDAAGCLGAGLLAWDLLSTEVTA